MSKRTGPPQFATTRWSLVVSAGQRSNVAARKALADLCSGYWYPLYAFVRRRGDSPHEAEDLIQDFFADLLERRAIAVADPNRGRFRSFLLASLEHFWSHRRDRASAKKRGGGRRPISLDFSAGEKRLSAEPIDRWTPERLYDRIWAMSLLERVLDQLEAEYRSEGKQPLFAALKPFLTLADPSGREVIADHLQMSPSTVRVAIHRLRRRYRDLLKEEIGLTVAESGDTQDEIDHLLAALGGM